MSYDTRYEVVAVVDQIAVDDLGRYLHHGGQIHLDYTPISRRFETSKEAYAFKEKMTLAINAHDKLLAAVKMLFENPNDIDWDMLRDAYNLGLKGEA